MASKRTKKKPVAKNVRHAPRRRSSPPIDRHQTTSALGENGDEFRATFNMTSVGFCQAEPLTGCFLRVNRAFCDMVGYEEGELLNRPFAEITHPDDRATNLEGYQRLIRGETAEYRVTMRYVRKDGRVIWVDVTVNLVCDLDGRPWRTVALIQDITERKQAEEQLRESEVRFRALVESVGDVFWISDPPNHKLIYVSQAFGDVWGRDPNDLYEHFETWLDAIHEDDRARVAENFFGNILTGTYDAEYRVRRPDGSIRWIHDRGKPLGIGTLVAGVAEDITVRKEIEAVLQEREERLRHVLETTQTAVWDWDIPGGKVFWTPQHFTMLGYEPGSERWLQLVGQFLPVHKWCLADS